MNRETVLKIAEKKYGTKPEYLWKSAPDYGVLRHMDNRKWYGIVMNVQRRRLGLPGEGDVDILDVKTDPLLIGSLMEEAGILPGYHMHKGSWISLLLDGTAEDDQIEFLLDMSFRLTGGKK